MVILAKMNIVPEHVVRRGATSKGYWTFLFDNDGKPCLDNKHEALITRFVPWSEEQKQIIWENEELFQEWFDE